MKILSSCLLLFAVGSIGFGQSSHSSMTLRNSYYINLPGDAESYTSRIDIDPHASVILRNSPYPHDILVSFYNYKFYGKADGPTWVVISNPANDEVLETFELAMVAIEVPELENPALTGPNSSYHVTAAVPDPVESRIYFTGRLTQGGGKDYLVAGKLEIGPSSIVVHDKYIRTRGTRGNAIKLIEDGSSTECVIVGSYEDRELVVARYDYLTNGFTSVKHHPVPFYPDDLEFDPNTEQEVIISGTTKTGLFSATYQCVPPTGAYLSRGLSVVRYHYGLMQILDSKTYSSQELGPALQAGAVLLDDRHYNSLKIEYSVATNSYFGT